MTKILAPISIGELYDKITILEIKSKKIINDKKLENINHELIVLTKILNMYQIDRFLFQELKKVNEELWQIEDNIRKYEKEKNFGKEFIDIARSVYKNNDKRFDIKNKINNKYNSDIVEEKSYSHY